MTNPAEHTILITGGAGYIATHTLVTLIEAGFHPFVIDNFSNSSPVALERVAQITGRQIPNAKVDIRDEAGLRNLFTHHTIRAVIHFAGLKAVGESVANPLAYYDNNVAGTITLCRVMAEFGCKTLVFSSSATVYGDPASVPICEDFPLSATNPYGRTKLMIEDILRDLTHTDTQWRIALLRYFNPIGAHPSGLIGEDPHGIPNNLLPFIAQVAVGKRSQLAVFGSDYPTPDGTGVRDYIHVLDLAKGHVCALQALTNPPTPMPLTVNLGTGRGYSVLEVIRAFEKASGRQIPFEIAPRRAGDVAQCYADPTLAAKLLGWRAEYEIEQMCADGWRWQSMNPDGYAL
ncbi:UDP-glucose 4-epimerase GalE [Chrysiogenes arsenatis]|uniref:UDP-glucose 4-epimerase GalE n=1 Tax=Chrysiogenes arsenatis TaxID=309797 RepID=UPI000415984F|nr:UDP-glucose 4-epimerase GalE [Chrysiogenes arsenatis]